MRIIILCNPRLDTFQQEVLRPILDDRTIEVVAALVDCRPRASAGSRFLKNLKRGRGGYMLVMLWERFRAEKEPTVPATEFFSDRGIAAFPEQDPYNDAVMQRLRWLQAESMVLVGGFGIVKEPLLSLVPGGILSYHHGDMRKYRGQPVGFWELYRGEREIGLTVQRLGPSIDKGIPIVEKKIPITRQDNVRTLRTKAMQESAPMMHEALRRTQNPGFIPAVIADYGPLYTLPNLRQFLFLQLKLFFRK